VDSNEFADEDAAINQDNTEDQDAANLGLQDEDATQEEEQAQHAANLNVDFDIQVAQQLPPPPLPVEEEPPTEPPIEPPTPECPPGFTLNSGICQAEPSLTCENYNVYQPRTNIDENGHCIVTEYTTAVCLNEEGSQILGYYFPGNDCIDTATKQIVPNAEPACSSPNQPWHPINTATLTTERGTIECVFYTDIGPADQKCDVGTLNKESGLCEIKPGNSNRT
jgi:hypothetical protein